MTSVETRLIQMKNPNHILVEHSLRYRVQKILQLLCKCYEDNLFFIHLKNTFSTNIKTNSDLYCQENRNLIFEIYDFLQYRQSWEEDFVYNYNILYDLNELNNLKLHLSEIDCVLDEINYIVVKLAEIVRLDYEGMKEDNIEFSEELVKYALNPDRLIRLTATYGL
jgi:hypothetical protein